MNLFLALGLVASAGLCVGALAWSLTRLARHVFAHTKGSWDDDLGSALAVPFSVLAGVLGAGVALGLLAGGMGAGAVVQARRLLQAVFVVAGAWGVLRLVRLLLDRATRQRVQFQPAARVSGRLVAVIVYAMAILTALSTYGISVTPVLTGLGIAALAVALALQDTLANFFAGIWIQTGRHLQPGHYVRLEVEKLEGYVEQVGWRTTRIRNLSGNTIVLPNNKLAQAVITDYNLPAPDMAIGIRFRVAFEAEPTQVIAALLEEAKAVAEESAGVVRDSPPAAMLAALADDCYVFEVSLRVTEFVQQFGVENQLRMRVLARFRKEGIRIPYPTRHNIQEPVQPPAERVATAPGGFSPPHRRPPRPKAVHAEEIQVDPRIAEAEKAKEEIAAQQEEIKEKEEERRGDGDKEQSPPKAEPEDMAEKTAAAKAVAEKPAE